VKYNVTIFYLSKLEKHNLFYLNWFSLWMSKRQKLFSSCYLCLILFYLDLAPKCIKQVWMNFWAHKLFLFHSLILAQCYPTVIFLTSVAFATGKHVTVYFHNLHFWTKQVILYNSNVFFIKFLFWYIFTAAMCETCDVNSCNKPAHHSKPQFKNNFTVLYGQRF
jgi:hypothetical protein